MASARLVRVALVIFAGIVAPSAALADQFVLFDVTFTFTKEDANNSKPSKSHYYIKGDLINKERPKDWTQPVDYRNGTVHIRAEVIEKPAGGEPTVWTLCYIPNKGQGNGYGCTGTDVYREKGVFEKDVSMKSFWENDAIVWAEGIKQMDLVIKDSSGGGGHAHKRADSEKFFPTKMRITMVQVAVGSKYDPSLVPGLEKAKVEPQAQTLAPAPAGRPAGMAATKADIIAMTPQWTGERSLDGRPKVADDLLKRMKAVSVEEAWDVLRQRGYGNQFVSGWQMLHTERPFAGRALTAAYLPARPDLAERIAAAGKEESRVGPSNSWPIDMLQQGDVYIADGFGKVTDGTLIGDNLGNAIYTKSGNGVVFDAGARDLEGLQKIDGFNAFVRGWDPSFLRDVVLSSINRPIRIGQATVLPGDVILAKREGIVAIPAHLAETVVVTAEVVALKDEFGHARLRAGVYSPGQIDVPWTEAIKADFFRWLDARTEKSSVPASEIEKHL